MNVVIGPGERSGAVRVPASKSQAHRLLIAAALGDRPVDILCGGMSRDIYATARCLAALGAPIAETAPGRLRVRPLRLPAGPLPLPCGESGSTLRFLLPVCGALGAEADFIMEGRLPQRPIAPLDGQLEEHGMALRREANRLRCSGRLRPGSYRLPGDVSSQFISGLLLALPLLEGDSELAVTGPLESAGYVDMTEEALSLAGIRLKREGGRWQMPGGQRPALPGLCRVEGDYSSAAFFLCSGAISERGITVLGLDPASAQSDRAVLGLLRRFGAQVSEDGGGVTVKGGALRGCVIDASQAPDLVPALAALAAAAEGETRIVRASRLRLKESDRLKSTAAMLRAVGADAAEEAEGLVIRGGRPLSGGLVSPGGDHRIAMAAAVAACACRGAVTIEDSECAAKSYPGFWEDFGRLEGGII